VLRARVVDSCPGPDVPDQADSASRPASGSRRRSLRGAAADLLVEALERVVEAELRPVGGGEGVVSAWHEDFLAAGRVRAEEPPAASRGAPARGRAAQDRRAGTGQRHPARPDRGRWAATLGRGALDHLGIARAPAFHYEPETNGVVKKLIQTRKEQLLWIERFETLEQLRAGLRQFAADYNELPQPAPGTRRPPPARHGTIAVFTNQCRVNPRGGGLRQQAGA
jgi:hypothetical protein